MKTLRVIAFLLISTCTMVNAVELPKVLENTINAETIKTVEFYREGWRLSNPIIDLNSDQTLVFSFDDLTSERTDYRYTLFHCDRNWKISRMAQHEYLDAYTDFPLTDFAFSRNTKFQYINYMVRLPNEDVQFKFSGNYALVVFDPEQPDTPLIIWRFYVVEQKVTIAARIHQATFDPANGEGQEVDFTIDKGSFPIQDPFSDLKVVITQNNRTDNAIDNLKPMFINGNVLEYDYNQENTFNGENEFRFFELRSLKYNGERVEELSFRPPYYHITLLPDRLRTQERYNYYQEMNGNFFIEAYNVDIPDYQADYMFVHFRLTTGMPMLGGGIYVLGKLTNWQFKPENEMKYNFDTKQYEISLLLKQGYYNFAYAFKADKEKKAKMYNLEGSHYETENEYQFYVYYGRITDRYDRLIGYNKFNSQLNRSSN
jgi:hypothetical protein